VKREGAKDSEERVGMHIILDGKTDHNYFYFIAQWCVSFQGF